MNSNTRSSIQSIQILRALAAWLVVLHHFGRELSSTFAGFFAQQGNFGVDIFFIISGFIIFYAATSKEHDAKTFLLNRMFRIVPAYWLATFIIISMKFIFPAEFSYTDWNIKTLISSLLFVPTENPAGLGPFPPLIVGWTLNIEIFFYVLLALCFSFGRRFRFVTCCIVLMLVPIVWQRDWFYGAVLGTRKLYEFVLGIVLGWSYLNVETFKKYIPRISCLVEKNSTLIASMILAPSLSFLYLDLDGMRLLSAFGIVTAGLLFEPVIPRTGSITKLLVRFGETSYSTYLFHYIVMGVMLHFLGRPQNGLAEFFEWVVLVTLVMIASHLGFNLVESNATLVRWRKNVIERTNVLFQGRLHGKVEA